MGRRRFAVLPSRCSFLEASLKTLRSLEASLTSVPVRAASPPPFVASVLGTTRQRRQGERRRCYARARRPVGPVYAFGVKTKGETGRRYAALRLCSRRFAALRLCSLAKDMRDASRPRERHARRYAAPRLLRRAGDERSSGGVLQDGKLHGTIPVCEGSLLPQT